MEGKEDIIESYKVEIRNLETQRELFLIQIDDLIRKRKQVVHDLLNPKLPLGQI